MKRFAGFLLACSFLAAFAPVETLRIGLFRSDLPSGCYLLDQLPTPEAAAYVSHVQARFSSTIELCILGDEASVDLSTLDLAWGDRGQLQDLSNAYRPFLTPRRANGLGRVPIVFFQQEEGDVENLREMTGGPLALDSWRPAALNQEMPLEVLDNFRIARNSIDVVTEEGPEAVVQAVRDGTAPVGALEASAWARVCQTFRADQVGCADMEEIATMRPRAEVGMVIRRSATKELRFRMVGVHANMHLENDKAFRWLVGPDVPELEPTEAEAFSVGLSEDL